MPGLLFFGLAGVFGQLVDGSLGMGFGVSATTVLLAAGTAPALASATVHVAKIGTGLASGISHWKLGNVDWSVTVRIALPGALGAFLGATVLSSLSTEDGAPWMSALLLVLGCYILVRFTGWTPPVRPASRPTTKFLAPLGLVAGFVDATGGGGWGPVATPTLVGTGKLAPRTTVGSVNASECLVAVAASAGFLVGLGDQAISTTALAGLLVGGVIAAPFAALLVRRMPASLLGVGVGGIVVLTNAQPLLEVLGVGGAGRLVIYLVLASLWVAAITAAVLRHRRSRETEPSEAVPAS